MESKFKCKIIFCDQIKEDENIIKNILPQLEPVNIPGNYTFTVANSFTGVSEEFLSKIVRVEFIDPKGKKMLVSKELPFRDMVVGTDSFPTSIMASYEFRNVVLEYEGEYCFKVYIDNKCIQTETIDVRKSGNLCQ